MSVHDNAQQLHDIACAMVARGRGILAMDESHGTCQKRFDAVNVPCNEDTRRDYRGMLITTDGLGEHVSGAILFDETLRQSTAEGKSFVEIMNEAGVLPGIKVDTGAHPLALHPGEKVTQGLDGLRERLAEYSELGARFAKWRAVITIADDAPTGACIDANCHALARYAALCQEAGIVPIVEPEVLMEGDHDIEVCDEVTEATLRALFGSMYEQNVLIEGTILKASMVISGKGCPQQADHDEVAERTVQCLKRSVPAALPGIVFLSGGQSDIDATVHLNLMNQMEGNPWPLSFSYGRALQHPALLEWAADTANNVRSAQRILAHRARMNGLAAMGEYDSRMEQ